MLLAAFQKGKLNLNLLLDYQQKNTPHAPTTLPY